MLRELLIVAAVASGADLKIDHITVAGDDLERLRAMFAREGIQTEFGGKHANGQTQMAIASFEDGSYLELIAPQPGADFSSHYWAPFMKANAGPCAWAIRSSDIAADMAKFKSLGIEVRTQSSGRVRPDGVELKWETADIGPGSPGSFFPFLIHDATPRERRVGKPLTSQILGVKRIIIAVGDLNAAIAKYRAAFALPEPKIEDDAKFGGRLATFPESPVILTTGNGWIAQHLKRFGESPCAFILASQAKSSQLQWLNLAGMHIAIR